MNFKAIKDADLVSELKTLVQKEREILAQVLEYLQEVESRKIHFAKGYPSLFEFATQELGYTAASAQRRIESMRLMKSIPEVATLIESGALSLSVAAQTQSFFKQENKRRLMLKQEKLSVSSKREILESVTGLSSRDCERKLTEISPDAILPKEKTIALKDNKTLIQFAADEELMLQLERIKELLSNKQLDNRYDTLFKEMAKLSLEKLEKKILPKATDQFPTSEMPKTPQYQWDRSSQPAQSNQSRLRSPQLRRQGASRYVPAKVRRAVYHRDGGRCVHQDPATGKICGSKHFLHLDHLKPFAWDGENTIQNLVLRCRSHNLYRAEQMGLISPNHYG